MSLQAGDTFSYYKILGELGRGGMAVVYHAHDTRHDREVALKIMHAHYMVEETSLKRFKREAVVIHKLKHPNIVPLTDYGQHEDQTYLAMRYLRGQSLDRVFQKPRKVVAKSTTHLLRQIASALDYAHQKGVVHRDLKLQNILLDEKRNAYLADFGIARITDGTRLTQTGRIAGTPIYMSPEQARGLLVDPRSDIYSFGVMTYLMVTGYYPFTADDSLAILHKHVSEIPPNPSAVNPALPKAVDFVLHRALMKNPEDRYETATEFIDALDNALMASDTRNTQTLINTKAINPIPSVPIGNNPTSPQAIVAPLDDVQTSVLKERPKRNNSSNMMVWLTIAVLLLIVGVGALFALSGIPSEADPLVLVDNNIVAETVQAELTALQESLNVQQTQTAQVTLPSSQQETLPPTWTLTPTFTELPTLEPLGTATPELEFVPEDNFRPPVYRISTNELEGFPLYESPSFQANIVLYFPYGQFMEVIGRTRDFLWLQVIVPDEGAIGWLRQADVDTSNIDLVTLPRTDVEALPPDESDSDSGLVAVESEAPVAIEVLILSDGPLYREPATRCPIVIENLAINTPVILLERTDDDQWVFVRVDTFNELGWIQRDRVVTGFDIKQLPPQGVFGEGEWTC